MGARTRINAATVNGCFLIAAVAGMAFSSWLVFVVTLAVLLAGAVHNRDIRPRGGR